MFNDTHQKKKKKKGASAKIERGKLHQLPLNTFEKNSHEIKLFSIGGTLLKGIMFSKKYL